MLLWSPHFLTELVDEAGQSDGAALVDHLAHRLRGERGHARDLPLGVRAAAVLVAGGRVLVVDVGVDVVVVVAVGQGCGVRKYKMYVGRCGNAYISGYRKI